MEELTYIFSKSLSHLELNEKNEVIDIFMDKLYLFSGILKPIKKITENKFKFYEFYIKISDEYMEDVISQEKLNKLILNFYHNYFIYNNIKESIIANINKTSYFFQINVTG